jgi:hypothetical protein
LFLRLIEVSEPGAEICEIRDAHGCNIGNFGQRTSLFWIGKPYLSNESASLLTLLPVPEAFSTALAIVDVCTGNGRLLDIVCSATIPGAPHKKTVIAAVAHALATRLLLLDSASNCVEKVLCAWLWGELKADADPTERRASSAEVYFILLFDMKRRLNDQIQKRRL